MFSGKDIFNKIPKTTQEQLLPGVERVGKKIDIGNTLQTLSTLFSEENKSKLFNFDVINTAIDDLRASDFDYRVEQDGTIVYVKVHENQTNLEPNHPREEQIQALMFLRGMVLIYQNLTTDTEENAEQFGFRQALKQIFNNYLNISDANVSIEKKSFWLVNEMKELLKKKLSISESQALKQLSMARDFGCMMTPMPTVCTISKNTTDKHQTKVTIELAKPVKIGYDLQEGETNYYNEYLNKIDATQPIWSQITEKKMGFKLGQSLNNWFKRFLTKKENIDTIIECGVPATPSSRMLPTPANLQLIETTTAKIDSSGQLINNYTTTFMRTGTLTAFGIKGNETEQRRLAKAQIKEIVRLRLNTQIEKFHATYGLTAASGIPLMVSYQTLLSPNYFEAYAYRLVPDNNAKFIEMTKEAMEEIKKEYSEKYPYVVFAHTNAAINSVSSWVTAKVFKEDHQDREYKFKLTTDCIERILPKPYPEDDPTSIIAVLRGRETPSADIYKKMYMTAQKLRNYAQELEILAQEVEIKAQKSGSTEEKKEMPAKILSLDNEIKKNLEASIRLRSAYHLRQLLHKQPPYDQLGVYQRNLMMAALEFHMMGSQAMHMAGCKSARDRTAIFAAAVKTMQENPAAMSDWKTLNDGIIQSLLQGHHTRAMMYHTAVVKVNDVHNYFMKQLPHVVQQKIKAIKKFSKLEKFYGNADKLKRWLSPIVKDNVGKNRFFSAATTATTVHLPREANLASAITEANKKK